MFSSIRSPIAAVCLLALGVMATPSPVFAAQTFVPDPAWAAPLHVTLDIGGPPLVGNGSGPPVASASLVGSDSVAYDPCEAEEDRFVIELIVCAAGAIPMIKLAKITYSTLKGISRAGRGARNAAKGADDAGDAAKNVEPGDIEFSFGEFLMAVVGGVICVDLLDALWELQECKSNQGGC